MKTEIPKVRSSSSVEESDVLQRLDALCQDFDHGRSQHPFIDAGQQLRRNADQPVLRISLAAFDQRSLCDATAWLGAGGMVDDERPRTSQEHHALEANRTLSANDAGLISSHRNPAFPRWSAVEFFAASISDLGLDHPDRFHQFCAHGHLLMLVLSPDEISTADQETAARLFESFPCILPVQSENSADTSASRWPCPPPAACVVLPTLVIGGREATPWTIEFPAALRLGLQRLEILLSEDVVTSTLARTAVREQSILVERLKCLDRAEPASGRVGRTRNDGRRGDDLKRCMNDELTEFDDQLSLENDRLIQPLGGLSRLIRDMVERISVSDFSREVNSHSIRLHLRSHQVAAYNRKLVDALQGQIRADLGNMDARHTELEQRALHKLQAQLGPQSAPQALRLSRLSFQRVWERVENLIDVGDEAEIELPRKSLFDLMGAGRQKVFFLIMFIALLGRMGIDEQVVTHVIGDSAPIVLAWMRTIFMAILLSTCVGAMINATLAWRDEKEEQTQKELRRIREALSAEAQKTTELVQREKRAVFRNHLKVVQVEAENWLDQCLREHTVREEAAEERRQHERELIQQRLQLVSRIATESQRLSDEISQRHHHCVDWLRRVTNGTDAGLQTETQAPSDQFSDPCGSPSCESSPVSVLDLRGANPGLHQVPHTDSAPPASFTDAPKTKSRFAERRAARKLERSEGASQQ